ncbi:MAG: hypothetical protein K9L17_13970 [Clostridiales bacterium]|nr:hypothetical protein [Clostridiales bacterium]MCF8023780.1 hypothetical protein [Clostridiales bacterium]
MNFAHVKNNVQWDFNLEKEFRRARKPGCTFVIDVLDGTAQLALYNIRVNYSCSTTLEKQPPRDILMNALQKQGYSAGEDGLYYIDKNTRDWIENNLF